MSDLSFQDFQIVADLRSRFKQDVDGYSDQKLLDEYKAFSKSNMAGYRDELFLIWLRDNP